MKKIFLLTLTLGFILFLTGCGDSGSDQVVNVYNWGEYIDADLLDSFEEETGIKVNYSTFETNEQLYTLLAAGGSSYDVIIPSDYMAAKLIEEDMLEEINFDNVPNIELIDERFLGLEYDPDDAYTVPYMWGTVGLIYNTTVVTQEVTSWGILFDETYAGQILMFDNPRDAFGIALKYLGYSLNTTNEDEINEAYELLEEQSSILQGYVMDQIFDKMESGEAAIAPYYAGDYLSMLENNPDLAFVIPEEGSNWFVDVMCIPKGSENKENAEAFINYMCSTPAALANTEEIGYTSPNKEVAEQLDLDDFAYNIMFPSDEVLANCEVYLHLPENILTLYDELWVQLKA